MLQADRTPRVRMGRIAAADFWKALVMVASVRRRSRVANAAASVMVLAAPAFGQTIEDGSGARIGPADTALVRELVQRNLTGSDAKISALRRSGASHICGSVNVKNRDGLYTGERGFLVDVRARTFGRVPDGPELLDPRATGFREKEAIRESYFRLCLDE
ncbi:hypothetical protein [Methylobacterium indicum]|uniref:hypothetical protein n=1 Tax=Methylobacterium indicum TaxID=1775910 RepID=UPI002435CFE7|nr:hypothetical protein [Methylobacterium indicum]